MIALESVGMEVDGRVVLEDLSFSIERGERVVLLGVNGCGKTTLLKLLDGLVFPTRGTVRYGGQQLDARALDDAAFRRRFRSEVALLFQNVDAMLFNPSVADEIAFGPRQLGLADVEACVARWAEAFGVADFAARAPFELSGGEKKRVALASIFAVGPKLLLLDEVTANLDPPRSARLVDFLAGLDGGHRRGLDARPHGRRGARLARPPPRARAARDPLRRPHAELVRDERAARRERPRAPARAPAWGVAPRSLPRARGRVIRTSRASDATRPRPASARSAATARSISSSVVETPGESRTVPRGKVPSVRWAAGAQCRPGRTAIPKALSSAAPRSTGSQPSTVMEITATCRRGSAVPCTRTPGMSPSPARSRVASAAS